MRELLKELFSSKKFVVFIVAAFTSVLLRLSDKFGIGIDKESAQQISMSVAGLAAAYVGAQGIADFGKSVAIQEKEEPPKKEVDSA